MSKDTAVEDFKMRIHHYEMSYEPLDEERDKDLSFIRIYNQGEKFLVNKVQGRTSFMGMDNDRLVVWLEYAYSYQISTYLTSNHECLTVKILLVYLCHTLLFILGHVESRVVYYLMNIHVLPRTIYITRVSFLAFWEAYCLNAKLCNEEKISSPVFCKQHFARLLLNTMQHCCQLYMNWTFTCLISL